MKKKYVSNQKYWNNKTKSYHDSTTHDLGIKITKTDGASTGWHNVGQNSTYEFNDTVTSKGFYNISLRNSATSIYKYWTSGIWYYSV